MFESWGCGLYTSFFFFVFIHEHRLMSTVLEFFSVKFTSGNNQNLIRVTSKLPWWKKSNSVSFHPEMSGTSSWSEAQQGRRYRWTGTTNVRLVLTWSALLFTLAIDKGSGTIYNGLFKRLFHGSSAKIIPNLIFQYLQFLGSRKCTHFWVCMCV